MKTTDQTRRSNRTRPSSRRGASGVSRLADRLKPVAQDSLEVYGLPSKGETRLNNFRTQEVFFNRILERYMRLCAINEQQLGALFASMNQYSNHDLDVNATHALNPEHARGAAEPFNSPPMTELAAVLHAFRKLREAITATGRKDAFARRAYCFGVHASVLCKDWESYVPALTSLLTVIHPHTRLNQSDLKEYVGLLILDQACRQGDIACAHETRLHYGYKDRRVELVLKALVCDNWVTFWQMKKAVDGYQRSILEFAEQDMRVHALKCLGSGYQSAERKFVEHSTDMQWADLVRDGVGWELTEGDRVLIKKPKLRPT